ncbi:UNVERIFIED_CONTAM: hypothetical protein FKN15_067005 [Acipenser sinensis]
MQRAIARVAVENLIEYLTQSDFMGIMIDESTDCTNEKTLMIYTKWLKNGNPSVDFLCVCNLEGDGTAEHIYNKIVEVFQEYNLFFEGIINVADPFCG